MLQKFRQYFSILLNCSPRPWNHDQIRDNDSKLSQIWQVRRCIQHQNFYRIRETNRYVLVPISRFVLWCLRNPIRVPRIENRVPRIREMGPLQVHTGFLTFSLKNPAIRIKLSVLLRTLAEASG